MRFSMLSNRDSNLVKPWVISWVMRSILLVKLRMLWATGVFSCPGGAVGTRGSWLCRASCTTKRHWFPS